MLSIAMDLDAHLADVISDTIVPDTPSLIITLEQYRNMLVKTPYIEEILPSLAPIRRHLPTPIPSTVTPKRLREPEGFGPYKIMRLA
jgi:hypothetical protein